MSPIVKKVAGATTTIVVLLFVGATTVLKIIGLSTVPEDAAALEAKLPAWATWLMSAPWWLVGLIAIALLAFAVWALWPDYSLGKEVGRLRNQVSGMAGQIDLIHQFASDQKELTTAGLAEMKAEARNLSSLVNTLFEIHHSDIVAEAKVEYERAATRYEDMMQNQAIMVENQREDLRLLHSQMDGKFQQLRTMEEKHFTQPLLGLVEQMSSIEARIAALEAKLLDADGS